MLTTGQGAQLQFGPLTLPAAQSNVLTIFVGQNGGDFGSATDGNPTGPTDNSQLGASGGSVGQSTSFFDSQGACGGSASVLNLNGDVLAVAGAGGPSLSSSAWAAADTAGGAAQNTAANRVAGGA